jgi:hypothetical protein
MTQSYRSKDKVEVGSLAIIGSLTDNTRTTKSQTYPIGSSVVPKRLRRTPTTTRT